MLFDCHTHSLNSDGRNSVLEMCSEALEKGLGGITITDHANMNCYEIPALEKIQSSLRDVDEARNKYHDNLRVLKGVELGEYTLDSKKADEILSVNDFDAILCSVHYVPKCQWQVAYNRVDFSLPGISFSDMQEYIGEYFDLLSETVDAFDFDILSHIQCPARYMSAKHKRETNIMVFEEKIAQILEKIIKRNIALELNTCVPGGDYDASFLYNSRILTLYKGIGGKMVTLGSDAHVKESIARNFNEGVALLKKHGFDSVYYFENRKPVEVMI